MWAATYVEPFTLAVNGDLFAFGDDVFDDFDLVRFPNVAKSALGFLTVPDFALDRQS